MRSTLSLSVALLTLALLGPAAAQEDEPSKVSLTVTGLSGPELRAKRRRFLAVNVVLENRGATPADGVLRAYLTGAKDDPRPFNNLFYERSVPLPPGGRRRETVYYYCQEDEPESRLCVSYQPNEGAAPPPVFPRVAFQDETLHVLAISSHDLSSTRELREAFCFEPRRAREVALSHGVLELLPRHPLGYASVDVVVASDIDPAGLDPQQVAALEAWVSSGGTLLLLSTGRGGEREASPLRDLYPVVSMAGQPLASRSLKPLERLAPALTPLPQRVGGAGNPLPPDPVPVERVKPRSGAVVLAGDAQAPLIVRQRRGSGTVQFLAFSVSCAPLEAWGGRAWMLSTLLPSPLDVAMAAEDARPAPPLEELVRNLSEAVEHLDPPSVFLVAPLIIAYVILVGPVAYLVLAKRKLLRFGLAVASGVACVFAIGFFLLSWAHKSDEAVTTRIGTIQLSSTEGDPSRIDLLTGHFSTERGLISGTAPRGSLLGPIALKHSTSRDARVQQDPEAPGLEKVAIATWSLRRFRLQRVEQLGHLEADLQLRDGVVSGTLRNASDLTLPGVALLTDLGWLDLPKELKPGAEVRVDATLTAYSPQRISRQLAGEVRGQQKRYTVHYAKNTSDGFGGNVPLRVEAMLRERMEAQLAPQLGLRALAVSWQHDAPAGLDFGSGDPRVFARSLVTCPLVVRVSGGVHRIRGWTPRVAGGVNWYAASEGIGSPPVLEAPEGKGTSYVDFCWRILPSADRGVILRNATLRWRMAEVPYEPKTSFISAWDPSQGIWITLADLNKVTRTKSGDYVWPEPGGIGSLGRFFDPLSGQLILRVHTTSDSLVFPKLEVEGALTVDGE